MNDPDRRLGRTRIRRITDRLEGRRPPKRELRICEADAAAGDAVAKVVGLAVDGCISHKAAHCGCAEQDVGPIFARFPGGSTGMKPDTTLPELEEVIGPMVVDCPASGTKHDGEVVVVLRSPYDGCHVTAGGVVRVVAGTPHSTNSASHPVSAAPDLIDAGDEPISVVLSQSTGSAAERPPYGLYLGSVRGTTDQGQAADPRHVVIYVHGVQMD